LPRCHQAKISGNNHDHDYATVAIKFALKDSMVRPRDHIMCHPIFRKTWQNAHDYLFLDSQDEIDALVGYLKANEANAEKSVYLSFSGDLFGRPAMLNVVPVDFSNGFAAFQTACAAPK
jgi:hypothetical protein